MAFPRQADSRPGRQRWAPWWAYVIPILAVNYLRQLLIPPGTLPETIDVLLAVGLGLGLAVVITTLHRRRPSRTHRSS